MPKSVDERYFHWLTHKVTTPGARLYLDLLMLLHTHEFTWEEELDGNRAIEGLELSSLYSSETGSPIGDALACSVLEMLIAFADRCSFQTSVTARDWFWIFIENLGLSEFRHVTPEDEPYIRDILDSFVNRSYTPNGEGGLFPLRHTDFDQRRTEIWHQFFEYLREQEPT